MLERFFPDEYYESTYVIDFEQYYKDGYRGVIFDIDNTLVPHGAPADERSIAFFERLRKMGFDSVLLSNNKEPRVAMFNEPIGTHMIWKAGKPLPDKYCKAMELMNTDTENTLFVGDQLFTDILGAKNAGIKALLVKPMNPKEEIQIVLKRRLEAIVLRAYLKTHTMKTGVR